MSQMNQPPGHPIPPSTALAAPAKPKSGAAVFFGVLALIGGIVAFLQAGMRGHSAGWEMMAIYSLPAAACALIGIAIRRNGWTYAGLVGGVLAIIGLLLGW